jgi:hypothetical protein
LQLSIHNNKSVQLLKTDFVCSFCTKTMEQML